MVGQRWLCALLEVFAHCPPAAFPWGRAGEGAGAELVAGGCSTARLLLLCSHLPRGGRAASLVLLYFSYC